MQHILMHQHAACRLRLDEQPDARVCVAEERLCVPLGPPLLIEVHEQRHEQRLASRTILVQPIRAQPVTPSGEAGWVGIHVPLECIAPDWCVRDKGSGVVRGGPSSSETLHVELNMALLHKVKDEEAAVQVQQFRSRLESTFNRLPLGCLLFM